MSDDAARFGRDIAALDDVTPRQTDAAVHVYAARLTGTTEPAADDSVAGQDPARECRLFTPRPDRSGRRYNQIVAALSKWSELSGHAAITPVHATGETPRPWLAVAVKGRPLTERAPLSVDRTRSVLAAVAEAIRHAETTGHELGPVDPKDVRVRPNDTTTASLDVPVNPTRWESASRAGAGTTGDGGSVHSLGTVAYYALTGKYPRRSNGTETTAPQIPSPSTLNSDVPTQFDAVVERALHADPDRRYESPYDFKRAVLFESQQPDRSPTTGQSDGAPGTDQASGETATTDQDRDSPPGPADETAAGPSQTRRNVSRRAMLGAVGIGAAVTTVGGTWVAATRVFGSTENRFPMFRYDAANTGHVADGSGPTEGVTELWRVSTSSSVTSSPVVSEDTVFLNDRNGTFYALDAVDGTESWSEDTNRSLPISGTLSGDGVHLSEQDDDGTAVTARGTATGTKYWSKSTEEISSSARAVAFNDGTLYTLGNGGIQVHDTETGDEQWLSSRVSVSSLSAAVRSDTLYFGGDNGRGVSNVRSIIAFDTDDQDVRWSTETGGPVISSPAVLDGVVYVGSGDSTVYALNEEDGTERWRFRTNTRVTSSPAVTDHQGGTVYIGGTDGRVYAIDTSDGTERWQFETEDPVISSPAVASNTVYVGGQGGTVYALDAETGDPRWTFDADGRIISSPAVVSNRLFIGTDEGTIYALTEP